MGTRDIGHDEGLTPTWGGRTWFRCGSGLFDLDNLSPGDSVRIVDSFCNRDDVADLKAEQVFRYVSGLSLEQAETLTERLIELVPAYERARVELKAQQKANIEAAKAAERAREDELARQRELEEQRRYERYVQLKAQEQARTLADLPTDQLAEELKRRKAATAKDRVTS